MKPKISVEIVHYDGSSSFVKRRIKEWKVIIDSGKRGFEGKAWEPAFSRGCIIDRKSKILGLITRSSKKLVVLEGAEHCVDWTVTPDPNLHNITRDDMLTLARLDSIRRSGALKIKHELPLVFWLLVLIGIVTLGIQFMQISGIRFV